MQLGSVAAQTTYKMNNGKVISCKGKLTDSEGNTQSAKKYANNENYIFTVCVKGASTINIKFNGNFCTEAVSDFLKVYKGRDTSGTLLKTYSGSIANPVSINASDTCITFYFHSDANIVCDGWDLDWEAKITSVPQPVFANITDPSCNTNKIRVSLDQKFNCDSVKASNFKLSGALSTGISSVTAINCDSKNETNTFDITFASGLNKSGNYALDFHSSFKDACDSVWKINARLNFKISDCPIKVDLKSNKYQLCKGNCANLSATVTGGNASNYSYSWITGGLSGPLPQTVCPVSDTRYILRVSDGVSVPGFDTIDVQVFDPPIAQNDTTVCQSSPAFALSALPFGGDWTGKGITSGSTGMFSPASSGSGQHKVFYTVGNCYDSVIVNVRPINAGPPNAACPGSAPFLVTGYSPPGGTWSGPNINSAGIVTPPSSSATFTVQYTWNGCVSNKTIHIEGISMPQFDTICQSVSADTFVFSPKGGQWSGPQVLNTQLGANNPYQAGAGNKMYIYSINGCRDTLNRTILQSDARWDEIACPDAGHYTLPQGLPAGGTWSGKGIFDAANGVFAPDSFSVPGRSTFTQTTLFYQANNGCVDSKIIYLRYTRFYLDTVRNCVSDTAYFMRYNYLLNDPWNMMFSGSKGIVGNSLYGQQFSPALAGRGSTNLIVGDANGCKDTLIIQVYPRANIQKDTTVCIADDPFNLYNAEKKGTFSGKGITNAALGTFSPALAGTGTHPILFDLPGRCTDTVVVTVNPLPSVSIGGLRSDYCFKDTNVQLTLNPAGGTLTGPGINGTVFNPVQAGSGQHSISYTFGTGKCKTTDKKDLTIADTLRISLSADKDTICPGTPVNLSALASGGNGSYRIDWNTGAFNVTNVFDIPKQTKTYEVRLKDACSDSSVSSVEVFVHPQMFGNVAVSPIQCYGNKGTAEITMQLPGNYAYTWNTIPQQFTSLISAPVGTTYKVRVTNKSTGCVYDTSARIPGYSKIRAYFTVSPAGQCIYSNNPQIQIIDLSEGGLSGYWDYGDGVREPYGSGQNPSHQFAGDTDSYTLSLYIRNEGNCADSFKLSICVLDTLTLFIPGAFTPNDDGTNDVFSIRSGSVSQIILEIYNRWGEKVFMTGDIGGAWDGKYKGNMCPTDYYVYVLKYKGKKTPWRYQRGYFYLVR